MARSFNGTNSDHLDVGNVAALTFPNADFSIATWAYTTASGAQQIAVNKQNAYRLFVTGGSTASLLTVGGTSGTVAGGTAVSLNAWHHLCGVYSFATTTGRIYLDGAQNGVNTGMSAGSVANANGTEFGRSSAFGGIGNWSGRLAEVAIWNRALTAAQVAALARGVAPFQAAPAGLVGYWPLWGASSTEADLSGGRHNAAVTGTAVAPHAPVGMLVRQSVSGAWAVRSSGGRNVQLSLAVAQPTAPLVAKGVAKVLPISQASVPALIKGLVKTLGVPQAAAPALTALKSRLVALSVVQATVSTMGKAVAKNLDVAQPQG